MEMMTDEKTPEVFFSIPLPLKTSENKLVGERVQRESGGLCKKEKKNGKGTLMQLVMYVLGTTSWNKYRKSGVIVERKDKKCISTQRQSHCC